MSINPDSGTVVEDREKGPKPEPYPDDSNLHSQECLESALQYFHKQIDQPIVDHTEDGSYPDRATTAREYYNERGWSDKTIDGRLLGWASPDNEKSLEAHLAIQGYSREEILATGLFSEEMKPLWHGRYVLPYFDDNGLPTYAISRSTGDKGGGGAGYDGHPDDFIAGKYAKLAHSKEYSDVSEPIFGLRTVRDGEPVIITEGIADAITLQQAGYAAISPVTTQFRRDDLDDLLSILETHAVPQVYVIQDAERPSASKRKDSEGVEIQQFGPGVEGAVKTATFLSNHDIDARVNTPPRPGLRKVDVDDYLQDGWGSLDALLRSAKPPEQHPAYSEEEDSDTSISQKQNLSPAETKGDEQSGLFDLDITDVTGLRMDYRGTSPLGHTGDSENYFVVFDSEWAYDHKRQSGYNPLTYLLCDAGERPIEDPTGSLSEKENFVAWKHAKEDALLSQDDPIPHKALIYIALEHNLCEREEIQDGWKLPREAYNKSLEVVRDEYGLEPGRDPYETGPQSESLHISPDISNDKCDATLTIEKARDRCQTTIDRALAQSQYSLIDALPAQGKSRGVVEWAAKTDTPLTVLVPRWELVFDEYEGWCDDLGLDYYHAPAFPRDCGCAVGDYDEGWEGRVWDLYDAGVTAGEIHQLAENKFGRDLPCEQDGGCDYMQERDFEAEEYDVIFGHYTHAYQDEIVGDRVVAVDETPADSFIKEFNHAEVESAITSYLQGQADIPFESYSELTGDRVDRYRKGDALKWFRANEDETRRNGFSVMVSGNTSNAYAPMMTYALLIEDNLGNGWTHAPLPDGSVGVRNLNPNEEHDEAELFLLIPPALEDARRVVGLDGTPWPRQWELCLGHSLDHYTVLDREERMAYLQNALDLTIYQMSKAAKPYSSGTWVQEKQLADDRALFEYIGEKERRLPDLISSKKAISKYKDNDMMGLWDKDKYYGDLKGVNQFSDTRVGTPSGSPHYGDTHVKKWGAFAGEAVKRLSENGGMELDYGQLGNDILRDMRENEVLQALMRFGRDGGGATIYVNTGALPEWVPVADYGEVRKWSDGMQQLLAVLHDRQWDEWRTDDLVTEDEENLKTTASEPISRRQVRRNLNTLVELGFLDQSKESGGWLWEDNGLETINEERQVVFTG